MIVPEWYYAELRWDAPLKRFPQAQVLIRNGTNTVGGVYLYSGSGCIRCWVAPNYVFHDFPTVAQARAWVEQQSYEASALEAQSLLADSKGSM